MYNERLCLPRFLLFFPLHRHPNFWRRSTAVAIDYAADRLQVGRDHHAADRPDRAQSQGRDNRCDTADTGCDQHRDQGVQVQSLRRRCVVRAGNVAVRPVRPILAAGTASVTGQEHTRARAYRTRFVGTQRRVQRPGGHVRSCRQRRRRLLEQVRRRVLRRRDESELQLCQLQLPQWRQQLPPAG